MDPCPLCHADKLVAYHDRANAACAACGALERQRALARGLAVELVPRGSARALESAPLNPFVFGGWLGDRGWTYESFDLRALRESSDPGGFDGFIDHDCDITDLRFAATASFELVMLQHVLEAIGDYGSALDELSRVLEPGGRALLEVPWEPSLPSSRHKEADRYGNRWRFGADLVDELRARFAAVEPRELREGVYSGTVFVCRAA